ncbi:MAG: hypothetical protein VB949_02685 [Pseudomonadales bacterium]
MKRGLSQGRACTLFSVARSSLYLSRMDTKDLPVIEAMADDPDRGPTTPWTVAP